MRVAVLSGGPSFERQVSIAGAENIVHGLTELGHKAISIDVGRDLIERLTDARVDAAIIVMHGVVGEDGAVQAVLESLGIPHQTPSAMACRRCWDKAITKGLLSDAGIAVPDGVVFDRQPFTSLGAARTLAPVVERLGLPLVVKPARSGSALGVNRAADGSALANAMVGAFSYDDSVIVERFVAGREFGISVIDGEALPAVEILPQDGPEAYDFEARYSIGLVQYECPANLTAEESALLSETAVAAAEALGVNGITRVDLILTPEGVPTVLELNNVPGMTDTSLLPMAAGAAGLSRAQIVAKMLPRG
ncbi:MAG: D-alanine--D-alanine ligase [Solirubrobacteraceae bacterium]|nr:D-alanine--D-alanine ligase [Solirubrobacteraceae bacterium]